MRILFMGTRPLGMKALSFLLGLGVEVDAVVPEDKDQYWLETIKNLPARFVEDDHLFLAWMKYDLIISVNYNKIIRDPLLSSARLGCINVHHSYNLRIRGRHSATHAILLARETGIWEHGTTIHYMSDKLDAGKIIATKPVPITEKDTARSLFDRCDLAAVELIEEYLPKLCSEQEVNSYEPYPSFFTFRKRDLPGKEIDFGLSPLEVYDLVRALTFPPFEQPYTIIHGKRLELFATDWEGASKYNRLLGNAGNGRLVCTND